MADLPAPDDSRVPARRFLRIDPVLAGLIGVVGLVAVWSAAPLATGAPPAVSSDARIEVEVPVSTSATPGWRVGESAVRLPNLSIPGDAQDVSSPGWRMATNWANGYEVRVRATTFPALRGSNAVDGAAANDAFDDFDTDAACPCPWPTQERADKGVFGYSVSVAATNGAAANDTAKWGTARSRKWRGFSKSSFRAYSTPGGSGEYSMTLHLRSMIPRGAVQREGSYRASLIVSAHPLL